MVSLLESVTIDYSLKCGLKHFLHNLTASPPPTHQHCPTFVCLYLDSVVVVCSFLPSKTMRDTLHW